MSWPVSWVVLAALGSSDGSILGLWRCVSFWCSCRRRVVLVLVLGAGGGAFSVGEESESEDAIVFAKGEPVGHPTDVGDR